MTQNKIVHFNIETDPHGWIQWKGTDVCMDVYCECGYQGHIDDTFAYYVKCPVCGQYYELNGHIQLIPVDEPDSPCVIEIELDEVLKEGKY